MNATASMSPVLRRAIVVAMTTGTTLFGGAVLAQDQDQDQADKAAEMDEVVVTGTRILREDYQSSSPLTTITAEQLTQNADVTLDTVLNTLPQVSPAGSSASNNPPNNGQSNVDLRALGANRNLVLIDGRRPMVSASNLTVDLNTIPQALIDRVEVITGGAGATYGADAIAGVVNIKLKSRFEGIDLRTSYSKASEEWDAKDVNYSLLVGANFADDRGNAVLAIDYANREELIKGQRPFSAIATSTTTAIPEGIYRTSTNAPSQAAINNLFASYGVTGQPIVASDNFGINDDGSLFTMGAFNSPRDALNYRYPIDLNVNTRFYPDFYSYNFDAVNLLILPLERRSLTGKLNFALSEKVEAFGNISWTEYSADTALAPTPVPSGLFKNPGTAGLGPTDVLTTLVNPGQQSSTGFIVPLTNPFIPADLQTLLASRTGDSAVLAGSGATEPFFMGYRTLGAGLRQSTYQNTVVQALFGLKGDITEKWRWEVYASEGRTEVDRSAAGNINVQTVQTQLERADGGAAFCEGGLDIFGRDQLSQDCLTKISVLGSTKNEFIQQIAQAYVGGEVGNLPAGPVSIVFGVEHRGFRYELDPGALSGPIAGFTTQQPAAGRNSFNDVFAEGYIPLTESLDLGLGFRVSDSNFKDLTRELEGGSTDNTYKLELSWQPLESLRTRASYQRAVRAPNFTELFDSGNTFPQIYDPCSSVSGPRSAGAPNAAELRALCIATSNGSLTAGNADTFVPLPGGQTGLLIRGNTDLEPEEGETITLGLVWTSPWEGALSNLRGTLDFYRIKLENVILQENVNLLISDCYNFMGTNPEYSAARESCQIISRTSRPLNNQFLTNLPANSADGQFPLNNGAKVTVDGIDLALDYGLPVGPGQLSTSLSISYLLGFEQQERDEFAALDYAGSISFFGEGIGVGGGGGSLPEIKANLGVGYKIGDFAFDVRARYIDGMKNRASIMFPGEPAFTGVSSVTYADFGVNWTIMDTATVRIGVNNVFNEEPPLYAPNVQSGTDPSLYDVVGRRVFAQVGLRF